MEIQMFVSGLVVLFAAFTSIVVPAIVLPIRAARRAEARQAPVQRQIPGRGFFATRRASGNPPR